jgi:hypothetical protein
MQTRLFAAILMLAAFASSVSTQAHAALYCDIPQNPEGFVALREKPSARGKVIVEMKAGDEVQLLEGSRGKWVEVLHWRGHDRLDAARKTNTRRGWVQARLIGACG